MTDTDLDQLNQALFLQSDAAWREGNFPLAFDLQDKITGLAGNSLAALIIRAGYLLLDSARLEDAVSWFNLAEEYIDARNFDGLPFLLADLYLMSAMGRIKAYRLAGQLDRIRPEIGVLELWLSRSEQMILNDVMGRPERASAFPSIGDECLLAEHLYPLWVDIVFGESAERFYSFPHDIETITFLYENAEKLTDDSGQQALLAVLFGYYVILNGQEHGYEQYGNLLRKAKRMSSHPAVQAAARDHAKATVMVIQENLYEVSLEDVEEALELDPENPVLLAYRAKMDAEQKPAVSTGKRMSVQLISAELTPIARNSIFFSEPERRMYEIMTRQFAEYLVLPNAALHTILDYKELQRVVSADEFRYYLQTHVDFCLVDKTTYRPVAGFELDSSFHDGSLAGEKDRRKNLFFRLANIPLIRLRGPGGLTDAEIETELLLAVQNADIGKLT